MPIAATDAIPGRSLPEVPPASGVPGAAHDSKKKRALEGPVLVSTALTLLAAAAAPITHAVYRSCTTARA